jgi:transcriptional regulator with XRE-family HTH domain
MSPEERERAAVVLRDRMTELGLTTTTLAAKAGVNESTVRRILRGQSDPSNDTRIRLAHALGWTLGTGMKLVNGAPFDLSKIPTRQLVEELAQRFL